MFFPFNGSLSSRFFWLAVSILAVFVASGYLWKRYQAEFKARPEYQVRREAILINPPPEFMLVDVKGEVMDQLNAEQISLLDQDLCQKLAESFLRHRSVAGVYSVNKSLNGIQCQLKYHQPVAALEYDSAKLGREIIPITSTAITLDADDIDRPWLSKLIRLQVTDLQLDRTRDQEQIERTEVRGCIAIAQQIQSEQLVGIRKITAINQFDQPTYQIEMNNGISVIWGTGPEQAQTNQASTTEKLAALHEITENYADDQPGFLNLDIRSGKIRRVIPKTAAR